MKDYLKYIVLTINTIILASSIIYMGINIKKSNPIYNFEGELKLEGVEEKNYEGEYLSLYMLGSYLCISDDDVIDLLKSGKLDGSYIQINSSYIFDKKNVKKCLDEYMIIP